MAAVVLAIMLIGLVLIATEAFNRINKAAVAMFVGASCWMLYIAYGTDFVLQEHQADYLAFLSSQGANIAQPVKTFIAQHVFLRYVAQAADIVLFLLATTTIVEVLSGNGCFDFAAEWLRTRKPRKLLWKLALLALVLSANLDNLVTVVLLIGVVHPLLSTSRLRRIYATVIVLAANCGGALTVIGDLTSLTLWNGRLVTPTGYSMALVLPLLVALAVMLRLMYRCLPARIEFACTTAPYRGDDTVLTRPQRLLMLFVGIGGLWFIPTFHRLTQMPPFVGALCVLGLLWTVHEVCNRQLLGSDRMVNRRSPLALQYANLQNLLFFVGLTLMFGALVETGWAGSFGQWVCEYCGNAYVAAGVATALSGLLGSVPTVVGGISLLGTPHGAEAAAPALAAGGMFWPLLGYAAALGGSLFSTGTIAGLLLMRMEEVSFGWYLRHITPKVLAGLAAGAVVWLIYALSVDGLSWSAANL